MIELKLPALGEGVTEAIITNWVCSRGQAIERDDPLLEVETDKVTIEVNAEVSGILHEIYAAEGDTVHVGDIIAIISERGEEEEEPILEQQAQPAAPIGQAVQNQVANTGYTGYVSPVVSRMVREHNIDLNQVTGTGRGGRITKKDVKQYLESASTAPPAPIRAPQEAKPLTAPATHSANGNGSSHVETSVEALDEVLPLTGMRQRIAEHMVMSKRVSPHATTIFEVDFSAVAAHRQQHKEAFKKEGISLTYTAYIMQAVALALREHPIVNSQWQEKEIILKREINIGMATALEDGLIVPVIKHADDYSLRGISRVIQDLAHRAREGKLKPDETRNGTFTVTNHGVSGSLIGMPIINQPQCGILGIGAIEKRVKVINDAIAIRPCAYLSLSFDHRLLDGAQADAFVASVKNTLEGWHD